MILVLLLEKFDLALLFSGEVACPRPVGAVPVNVVHYEEVEGERIQQGRWLSQHLVQAEL